MSEHNLKKILILIFCSVHMMALLFHQFISISGTPETNSYLAKQAGNSVELMRQASQKLDQIQSQFPGNMISLYRILTLSTMPFWFFPLGSNLNYYILSVESSDPGKEPVYSTCPDNWQACISGAYPPASLDYKIFEGLFFISDFGPQSAFAYLAKYGYRKLGEKETISIVKYSWPIQPYFAPHQSASGPHTRTVIFSYP